MSKKCTPLWREAHFQVKSVKNSQSQTTFGSSAVEKVHAVVARSTFPSQNVQNTPTSGHSLTFRCRPQQQQQQQLLLLLLLQLLLQRLQQLQQLKQLQQLQLHNNYNYNYNYNFTTTTTTTTTTLQLHHTTLH